MTSMGSAATVDVEADALAAIDACYEKGWTDGLPVVPAGGLPRGGDAGDGRTATRDRDRNASHYWAGVQHLSAAAVNAGDGRLLAGVLPGARCGARSRQRIRLQLPRLHG